MVVPAAIPTGEPSIMLCRREAWRNCIKPPYPNAWLCSERVTPSSKCGSVCLEVSRACRVSVSSFIRSRTTPATPAFFGGRTGAVALHAVAGEGEEIRYVDVTSLYPRVNKNCPYPIGHPQIITQPVDQSLGSYFVSPRWTFFPLLVCFTPSCHCAAVTNSPFLSAAPVSRKSRPNPC